MVPLASMILRRSSEGKPNHSNVRSLSGIGKLWPTMQVGILLARQISNESLVEQMLTDIQAVIFDLDGTLLDRRRSFERFVRDQWQRFAHCLQAVDREQYVQTLIALDRDGYAPRKELF